FSAKCAATERCFFSVERDRIAVGCPCQDFPINGIDDRIKRHFWWERQFQRDRLSLFYQCTRRRCIKPELGGFLLCVAGNSSYKKRQVNVNQSIHGHKLSDNDRSRKAWAVH